MPKDQQPLSETHSSEKAWLHDHALEGIQNNTGDSENSAEAHLDTQDLIDALGKYAVGDVNSDTTLLPELYSSDINTQMLTAARELTPDIDTNARAIYLGSAADTSFADVYGKQTVHVDTDADAIAALKEAGYQGESMNYETYANMLSDDTGLDIVYSHNSGLVPDVILDKIRPGGYVIANNWHGSANDMAGKDLFEIVGAINPTDASVLPSDRASRGLGTDEFAIGDVGKMLTDSAAIDAIRDNPNWIVDKSYKNTEAKWVFRKSK